MPPLVVDDFKLLPSFVQDWRAYAIEGDMPYANAADTVCSASLAIAELSMLSFQSSSLGTQISIMFWAPSVVPHGRRECSSAWLHCQSWAGRSERRHAILRRMMGHQSSMGQDWMYLKVYSETIIDGTNHETQFLCCSHHTLCSQISRHSCIIYIAVIHLCIVHGQNA